jgi:hypothetical protein
MGFSISWIAVRGKPKGEILTALALQDTGEPDVANESAASGAELPGGWYILFLNDVMHPFTEEHILAKLSRNCDAVTCQVEEHVMASAAFAYTDGVKVWDIRHESERGPRHLREGGMLPEPYQSIKRDLIAQQDKGDAEEEGVDYIWDIPVTLAFEAVGYRHDHVQLNSGEEPTFTRLAESAA